MRRRLLLLALLALGAGACRTTPRVGEAAEPTLPPSRTATVAETPPPPAPEPVVEPPRDPEAARLLVERGREVQRARGEDGAAEAVALYRQALERDHRAEDAYWELGWSYQLLDDWDEVMKAWDALRALNPRYPELDKHYPVAKMRRDQAAALAKLPDPGALPPPEEEPREGPRVRIAAVGDVMMGRAWPEERATLPPNDAMELFDAVKERLRDADITFGNLETVLADEGDSQKCGKKSTKCFAFRVPTKYAEALKRAGFTMMSIANNHTGDFGPEGRVSTIEALDRVGIAHSGPVGDVASVEVNGLRVAMVAFSTGQAVLRIQDLEVARKVVADLDKRHDLVIVSFHGGAEGKDASRVPHGEEIFYGENRGHVRAFARTVVDAGADLVLGHGPHLLRGAEIYKGRFIIYSLGNFSSWETFSLKGALGITGILKVELATNGVLLGADFDSLKIEEPGRPVPDPKGEGLKLLRELSREDFSGPIFDEKGRYRRPSGPAAARGEAGS